MFVVFWTDLPVGLIPLVEIIITAIVETKASSDFQCQLLSFVIYNT